MNARVRFRVASLAAAALLTMALGVAPVAGDAPAGSVVVLSTTLVGGSTGPEVTEAQALGFTVDVKTPAQWAAMTAVDFEAYRAIILADPTCSSDVSKVAAAAANAATWGPVVNGDVIVIGADPSYHYGYVTGAHDLVHKGIALATGQSGKTGAYIALSCYYAGAPAHTAVPMLAGLSSFGGFTTVGVSGYDSVHIVASAPALAGLTDALLSNWHSTVHEAFDSWPSDFVPYAIATTGTVYTSSDGVVGTPFILTRGPSVQAISSVALDAPAKGTNGSPVTLTATVVVNGSPVAGVTVTFTATSGPDKGVLGTGITNASGVATLSFTGTNDAVDVVVASYSSGIKTFTSGPSIITWAASAATKYLVTSSSYAPVAGTGVTISAQLADVNNNPVATTGAVITWTKSGSGGSFATATSTTNGSGIATVVFTTSTAAGTATTVTATDAGALTGTSATITTVAGAASASTSTVVASPPSVTANGIATSTITVTLLDANSNPVSGRTVTLAQSSGPGSPIISAASGSSDVSGVVTFTVTSTTAGADAFTATDTTDSVVVTPTASVTFTAGAATKVWVETLANGSGTVVPAQNLASGAAITVYVISRDTFGNFVANVSATWSLGSSSGGVVSGDLVGSSTSTTGTSAVFTGHLTGTATIHAINGSLTTTDSGLLTVTALDHITLSPSSATITAGGSQAYTATGFDADDNSWDATSLINFTIDGGGSCDGALCTATVAGDHIVTGTDTVGGTIRATATLHVDAAADTPTPTPMATSTPTPTPGRAATPPPTSTGVGPASDGPAGTILFLPVALVAFFGSLLLLVIRQRRRVF